MPVLSSVESGAAVPLKDGNPIRRSRKESKESFIQESSRCRHSSCSAMGQLVIAAERLTVFPAITLQSNHEKAPIHPILHAEAAAGEISPDSPIVPTASLPANIFLRLTLSERSTSNRCHASLRRPDGYCQLLAADGSTCRLLFLRLGCYSNAWQGFSLDRLTLRKTPATIYPSYEKHLFE